MRVRMLLWSLLWGFVLGVPAGIRCPGTSSALAAPGWVGLPADQAKTRIEALSQDLSEIRPPVEIPGDLRPASRSSKKALSREEQIRRLRSLLKKLMDLHPHVSGKSRPHLGPIRKELEALVVALAAGETRDEISRRFAKVADLLKSWSSQGFRPCAYCRATGIGAFGRPCSVCGGDGQVTAAGDAKPCAGCRGWGRDAFGKPCPGCSGSGWANPGAGPGSLARTCALCQGRGKNAFGRPCTSCGGDGYVVVPVNPEPCAGCRGSGREALGLPCPACRGTGWANAVGRPDHAPSPTWRLKLCGLCQGKGRNSLGQSCPACGGDGYVAVTGDVPPCASCRGRGTDSFGRPCAACKGTGWSESGAGPVHGEGTVQAQCASCQGSGRDSFGNPCRACGGDGSVVAPPSQKPCAGCQGSGLNSFGRPCFACGGTGWARTPIVREEDP